MKYASVLLLLLLFLTSLVPAMAQDDMAPLVEGLNNPRRFVVAEDGTVYITNPGTGGDIVTDGMMGPVNSGFTGQVLALSPDGELSVALDELPSAELSPAEYVGPSDIIVTEDAIWVAIGEGSREAIEATAVVQAYDRETGELLQTIDIWAAEEEFNPDPAIVQSNPNDIELAPDGTLFIADAGCNCVWKWTEADGISVAHVWEDNPVPTSITFGDDGSYYIGFLTGFPFPVEGARIEHYSADGELVETFEGLTMVTSVAWFDGTLYAVEFAQFGEEGPVPGSGRVVTVSADGVETYAEGLVLPYHIAFTPDGQAWVSVFSAFMPEPNGMIIPVGGM